MRLVYEPGETYAYLAMSSPRRKSNFELEDDRHVTDHQVYTREKDKTSMVLAQLSERSVDVMNHDPYNEKHVTEEAAKMLDGWGIRTKDSVSGKIIRLI